MAEGLTLEQLQARGAVPIERVGGSSTKSGGLTADELRSRGATPGSAPVPATPKAPNEFGATFQATGNEGLVAAPLKTLGNIPSSAVGFAKGAFQFLNPLNTWKSSKELGQSIYDAGQEGVKAGQVIKGLPKAAYETLVPKFFQALFSGDTKEASRIIQEDPVGQLAPVILAGRGIAEKAGYGAQFDSVMKKTTSVATAPLRAIGNTGAKVATNALGLTTGVGGEAVRTAFQGGKDFTNAMRGKTSMQEVLGESQDALGRLKNARSSEYQSRLTQIKGDKANLDISPLHEQLQTSLNDFGVKPVKGQLTPESFSRSVLQNDPAAQAIFTKVYDNLKSYGTQAGDRTPIALDTLKRSLGDLYSDSSSVRSFTSSMYDTLNSILKKDVKGYAEMTKGYQEYSTLIKDIKQNLAVGGKAGEETAIKRLSGAMRQNNELRLEVLKDFESKTGINLKDKIAGAAMGELFPRGLLGKGIDYAAVAQLFGDLINPAAMLQLMITSPRLVGELMNATGIASRGTWKVLKPINEAPMLIWSSSKTDSKVP